MALTSMMGNPATSALGNLSTGGSFLQQSMSGMNSTVNSMWGAASQSANLAAQCMQGSQAATDGLGQLAGMSPGQMAGDDMYTTDGLTDPTGYMTSLINGGGGGAPGATSPAAGLGMPNPSSFINQIAGLNTGSDGLLPTGMGGGLG